MINFHPEIRRVLYALGFLLGTMAVGIAGFMLIEDYGFVDALYMTSITLSTVGFGALKEWSTSGKIFVVFLIFLQLGTFVYGASIVTSFVVEGELKDLYNRYRFNKEISKMRDHIIICGLGRNGREAARELMDQGIPFLAIEKSKVNIDGFLQLFPEAKVLEGDATTEQVLRRAGIGEAFGIITCLSEDTSNVFVTLSARELNAKLQIVARASQENSISKLRTAGANHVVMPNMIGGRKMANVLTKPALVEFVDFISGQGESRFNLEEIDCSEFPALTGKKIGELEFRAHSGALVVGYRDLHGKFHLNPSHEKKFSMDDVLFVLGTEEQLKKFKEVFS